MVITLFPLQFLNAQIVMPGSPWTDKADGLDGQQSQASGLRNHMNGVRDRISVLPGTLRWRRAPSPSYTQPLQSDRAPGTKLAAQRSVTADKRQVSHMGDRGASAKRT